MIQLTVNARYKNRSMTGVERFAFEVEKQLRQDQENIGISEINPGKELAGIKGHIWEQLTLPTKIDRHHTLFSPCNTGPIAVRNQVVVIHDAAVWDYPEGFSKQFGMVYRALLPRVAAASKIVGTVSDFSKSRLIDYLKISEEKITVLGNAAGPEFCPASDREPSVSAPRFFTVSSLDPRKNFERLVEVWQTIEAKGHLPDGAELRIAGGANSRNFSSVDTSKSSDSVKWLGRISDQDLIKEYQTASAFIYPSIYEGFGLPPLEAMACGCPVLLSDRASLPEVGGAAFDRDAASSKGAVLYFDPTESDDIATTIKNFIQFDQTTIDRLSNNARNRSLEFGWDKVAAKVVTALKT